MLESTPIHPIWSEDWQAGVHLGELHRSESFPDQEAPTYFPHSGEILRDQDLTATVLHVTLHSAVQPIYNIEVQGQHVYQVGLLGLLVHNTRSVPIPLVKDPKLRNLVKDLFKGARSANPIGTWSTADAVRNELLTGLPTAGWFHSEKDREYIRALEKWLKKNPHANHYDCLVAQSLLNDLRSALLGK